MRSPIVYCGPMWGGKTEALVSRLVRARLQDIPTVAFNPLRNNRFDTTDIRAHSGARFPATPVETGEQIVQVAKDSGAQVVGIDEFFMIDDCFTAVTTLVRSGCKVIVATLDLDSEGRPWESVGSLLAIAAEVVKCPAVCAQCKRDAYFTFRRGNAPGDRVLVGADDFYEPRCGECFRAGQEAKRAAGGEGSLFG